MYDAPSKMINPRSKTADSIDAAKRIILRSPGMSVQLAHMAELSGRSRDN